MTIKYSDIPRDEAVQTMAESIRGCDRCDFKDQSLCGYHQAEIKEMQYEFTVNINKEILSFLNKTDKRRIVANGRRNT